MRRTILCVLAVLATVLASAGYSAGTAAAQEQEAKPATQGELRWHGSIVRLGKNQSTLDVRKGTVTKTIHYDSSTQWTKGQGKQPAEMSEFTEGSDVICLGKADEKGQFHATKIDLRAQGPKP